MHEILEKRPYKHFKGNLYYVHEIVCHWKLENCTFHIKHSIVPINFILSH